MAADTLTIPLTGQLADDVRAAADARGLTPEDYVRQQLAWDIETDKEAAEFEDLSWEEDVRRMEEPGENIPLDQAFDQLRAKIAAIRAALHEQKFGGNAHPNPTRFRAKSL